MMTLSIEPTKKALKSLTESPLRTCDHKPKEREYENESRRPGNLEIRVRIQKFGEHGFYNHEVDCCLECAARNFPGFRGVRLKGVDPENPLGDSTAENAAATALGRLTEKNPETVYWTDGDRLYALGPAREKLAKGLRPAKVTRPEWADKFQRILERTSFAGWVDSGELTAMGKLRLEECAMEQTALWFSLRKQLIAAASGRSESRGKLEGSTSGHEYLKQLLNRRVHFRGSPEIGVVLQRLAYVPLVTFAPDKSERLDAIGNLGWGRFARVQVEELQGAPGPLKFTLESGSMKSYDEPFVIRGVGGDARLWIEVGFASALESIPPPIASRRRRAAATAADDDDDDGGADGGNWPSTTGNPSGGGRGNAPPSR